MISSQSACVTSWKAPRLIEPPLFTRMSGTGNSAPSAAASLSMDARLAWSALNA